MMRKERRASARRFLRVYGLAVTSFVSSCHFACAQDVIADAEKFALNQPSLMTPRALGGVYNSVAVAGKRLVAVGERGWIIISDDNGITWHQIETPTSVTLAHVAFSTPNDGWVVGGMGIVLHSSDAGETWTKQLDGAQAGNIALTAAEDDIKKNGNNDARAAVLLEAQQMAGGGPSVPFLTVLPYNDKDLIIGGAFGMAFSSEDGGLTWHSLLASIADPNGLHIYSFVQNQKDQFAIGEQGLVLHDSGDGNFTAVSTPFQGTFFGGIFAPDHALLIFGLQGTVLRSTDDGAHWSAVPSNTNVGINCGIVTANGAIMLGDAAGHILVSHDNGQSFTATQAREPIEGMIQARDGSLVIVGPGGPERIVLDKLGLGA